MYFQYANVLVFTALAIGLVAVMGGLGALLRPRNPEPGKATSYECGEPPTGRAWMNFNIRFYLVALVFLIFDVEVAFIYPVATVFRGWVDRGLGWFALLEIAVFLGILLLGLVYVWVKRDLEWLKVVPERTPGGELPALRRAA